MAGSTRSYTQAEIDNLKKPPDWFPELHPQCQSALLTPNNPYQQLRLAIADFSAFTSLVARNGL
jgi:hypothetical protein